MTNDAESAKQPLISIVTPVYNAEKFLGRCLENVSRQSHSNWEMLLSDDGSTDGTAAICDAFASKDSRIKVIRSSNAGPATARNKGLDSASGEFVYFLDADDQIAPDALAKLLSAQAKDKSDMAFSSFACVDSEGKPQKEEHLAEQDKTLSRNDILAYLEGYLKRPNRMPMLSYVWGKLYRAEIIREAKLRFDPSMRVFEDTDFNFRYLKHANSASCLRECLYKYTAGYLSPTTASIDFEHKMFDPFKALKSLGELVRERHPDASIEKITGHACTSLCIIQSVRLCSQADLKSFSRIYSVISRMSGEPFARACLKYYSPVAEESRLLPFLIKLRLTLATMLVCWWKARKRYGKMRK